MNATAAQASVVATPVVRPVSKRSAPLIERQEAFTSFPKHYLTTKKFAGDEITFRAIQPEDEPLLLEFHKTLSDQSVHFRYFGVVSLRQRTLHERLRRHCALDHTREFALVADRKNADSVHQILGVARLFKDPNKDEAEFAILISDSWQGRGLGTFLLKLLVGVARESHLHRIIGRILADNRAMVNVSRKAGFSVQFNSSISERLAEIQL